MQRRKKPYHVTVRYFSKKGDELFVKEESKYTILAPSEKHAKEFMELQLKKGNNPKVKKYDSWECCISKF